MSETLEKRFSEMYSTNDASTSSIIHELLEKNEADLIEPFLQYAVANHGDDLYSHHCMDLEIVNLHLYRTECINALLNINFELYPVIHADFGTCALMLIERNDQETIKGIFEYVAAVIEQQDSLDYAYEADYFYALAVNTARRAFELNKLGLFRWAILQLPVDRIEFRKYLRSLSNSHKSIEAIAVIETITNRMRKIKNLSEYFDSDYLFREYELLSMPIIDPVVFAYKFRLYNILPEVLTYFQPKLKLIKKLIFKSESSELALSLINSQAQLSEDKQFIFELFKKCPQIASKLFFHQHILKKQPLNVEIFQYVLPNLITYIGTEIFFTYTNPKLWDSKSVSIVALLIEKLACTSILPTILETKFFKSNPSALKQLEAAHSKALVIQEKMKLAENEQKELNLLQEQIAAFNKKWKPLYSVSTPANLAEMNETINFINSLTPLHILAGSEFDDRFQVELETGSINKKDSNGHTPLDWAIKYNKSWNIDKLIEAGAKKGSEI